jgi:hypothetical protein
MSGCTPTGTPATKKPSCSSPTGQGAGRPSHLRAPRRRETGHDRDRPHARASCPRRRAEVGGVSRAESAATIVVERLLDVFTPARAAIRLRAVVSARELAAGGGDRRRGHSGIRVAARSAGWLSNALAPLVRSPFRRVAVSPRTDSGADDHGVLHGFEVALDTGVVARARTRLLVFDGRLSASLARFWARVVGSPSASRS